MNTLVFLPNGLNSPEFEFMLSKSQELLNKKKKITILSCAGKSGYACSLNVYAMKSICVACKKRRNKGLSMLRGEFKLLEINQEIIKKKIDNKYKIKNLNYKNFDVGMGVFSSYTNLTRDTYLKGYLAQHSIDRLYSTSITFYEFIKKFFLKNKFKQIIIFNSRMSEKRGIFRAANFSKLKINNYEKLANENFYNFEKYFSQDRFFLKKKINKFIKNNKQNFSTEKKFYHDKFHSISDLIHEKVYTNKQKKNFLPSRFNSKIKNITYFTVSDDEHQSFGKDFNPPFLTNQKQIIEKICKMIEKKNNHHLWIRMHPRLSGVPWAESEFYNSLQIKYKNVSVILPDSKVSSYALMYNSQKVICYWSLLIPETAFWRKMKPISFVKSDFTEIGISIVPKNIKHLEKLIFSKNKYEINLRAKALGWAKFYLSAGKKVQYLSRYSETGFKFRKRKIKIGVYYTFMYLTSKFLEKNVLSNFISYIFRSR